MIFFKKFGKYFYDNFYIPKRRRRGRPKPYMARYSRKQRQFPLDFRGFRFSPFLKNLKQLKYTRRKYLYFLLLLFPYLCVPNLMSFDFFPEYSLLFYVEKMGAKWNFLNLNEIIPFYKNIPTVKLNLVFCYEFFLDFFMENFWECTNHEEYKISEEPFRQYLIENKYYKFFLHYTIAFSYIMEPLSFFFFLYWKYLSKFYCLNSLSFFFFFNQMKLRFWFFPIFFNFFFFFLKWVAIIKGF